MDAQLELNSSKEIIIYLSNLFPHCFTMSGEAKPLKIGIFQDLVERLADNDKLSKTKLRAALRSYTVSWRYLHCIKEGAYRVDLDGNNGDVITASQAEYAQNQLKESKEKVKAARKVNEKAKPKHKNFTQVKSKSKVNEQNTVKKVSSGKNSASSKPLVASIDIAQLKVNDNVKVLLGSKPVTATISSIEKSNIKVKVASGMELTVTIDRILL